MLTAVLPQVYVTLSLAWLKRLPSGTDEKTPWTMVLMYMALFGCQVGALFRTLSEISSASWYAINVITQLAILCIIMHKINSWYQFASSGSTGPFLCGWVPWIGVGIEYGANPPGYLLATRDRLNSQVFSLYMTGNIMTFVLDPEFQNTFYKTGEDRLLFWEPLKIPKLDQVLGRSFTSDLGTIMHHISRKFIPKLGEFLLEINQVIKELVHESFGGADRRSVDAWSALDHILLAANLRTLVRTLSHDTHLLSKMKKLEMDAHLLLKRPGIFSTFVLKGISERRKELKQILQAETDRRLFGEYEKPNGVPDDLLDVMLTSPGMDAEVILDSVIGMLFAAATNTNSAAFLLICHLITQPDLMTTLRGEIDSFMAEGELESVRSFVKLPFLDACITETTRLYSALVSLRTTVTEFDVMGIRVPPHRSIAITPNLMMRQNHLFPDAHQFNPFRFYSTSPSDQERVSENKKRYFGFGRGVHMCKGMGLAKQELRLMMIHLISGYEFHGFEGGDSDAFDPNGVPKPDWISFGVPMPMDPNIRVVVSPRSKVSQS